MEVTCKELIKAFEELNGLIQVMHEHSSLNFLPLTKQIKSYYNGLSRQGGNEEKIAFLNKIIVELQFHDIIRQKLEHIEHIHSGLIDELMQKNKKGDLQNTRYIHILPEIARLTIAQLEVVNEEFGNAIEEITKNMKYLEAGLREASIETSESFYHASSFFYTSRKIIDNLKSLNSYLTKGRGLKPETITLDYIEEVYTMESERTVFYTIFNLTDKIVNSNTASDKTDGVDAIEFF